MKTVLPWLVLGLLMIGASADAQTLRLEGGTEIEGEIRRTEGQRVTIASSSGIATYDIMEFDEATRRAHFPDAQPQPDTAPAVERGADIDPFPDPDAQAGSDPAPKASFYLYTILFVLVYAGFVLGALLCFFGRRWFRQLMAVVGVCLGSALGWMLARHLLSSESFWAAALTIAVTAMLLGLLFAASVYLTIFLNGFSLGALVASLLWMLPHSLGVEAPQLLRVVVLVLGIAGGITALSYRELVLAIATAFWGASLLVYSVFGMAGALVLGKFLAQPAEMMPSLLEWMALGTVRVLLPVAVLALTISGALFQIRRASRVQ